MKLLLKTFIVLLFLFFANSLYANEPIKNKIDSLDECVITLKDGSSLIGKIISSNSDEIKLQTTSGVLTIKQSNIVSIVLKKNAIKNNNYNQNYNSTKERIGNYEKPSSIQVNHKYFWTNNYSGLKKKELFYQNIWVMYNGMDYGITDNFSIGGGLLFLFVAGFVNVHARTQFEVHEYVKIGAAYNYFAVTSLYSSSSNSTNNSLSYLSGGITFGNNKYNFTLSAGRFSSPTDNSISKNMNLTLGGSVYLSKNLSFITDNIKLTKTEYSSNDELLNFNCLGLRFLGKSNVLDVGIMAFIPNEFNPYRNSTFGIPYIALNYKIK